MGWRNTEEDSIDPKEVGPPGVRGFSKKKSGVRIVVHDSFAGAFAKDGAPNEAQRRRAFGGCGRWRSIPDTAEDRTTLVESIGRGQKRGWSVVCEPRAIQSASGWVHGLRVSHCIPPFLAAVTFYSVINLKLNWPTPLRS